MIDLATGGPGVPPASGRTVDSSHDWSRAAPEISDGGWEWAGSALSARTPDAPERPTLPAVPPPAPVDHEPVRVVRTDAVVLAGRDLSVLDTAALCARFGLDPIPSVIVLIEPAAPHLAPVVRFVVPPRLSSSIAASPPSYRTRDGRVELDVRSRTVCVDGSVVPLSRLEFDLLACLMASSAAVVDRAELLERVWGYSTGSTATITVHVQQLRRKIEQNPRQPVHILTARGIGYRFEL